MCGIVGYAGARAAEHARRMNSMLLHRGPDDEGLWFDESTPVALAMRRLSIIDIAGGHQPMMDASKRYVIVYNGEVVNAPALREYLEANRVSFRTHHSDTEVILNLYALEGPSCVDRLEGMFAFAIYDLLKRRIFLARDALGIKPLFYFHDASTFAFSSELKSLKEAPSFPRDVDRQSVHDYLTFQFIPAPATIYRGVRKLPAGHTMTFDVDSRRTTIERYWRPTFSRVSGARPDRAEIVRTLRFELERSVQAWATSDVEIGASLSGGIDSAALVGLLSSGGRNRIKTWTLGFVESGSGTSGVDERAMAAKVAARWNTEHHEIVINADALIDDLGQMVESLDEPYAGGLPSWYVFRAMSRYVKVGMVGTGGDELFGNYGKWRVLEAGTLPWLKMLRHGLRRHGVAECFRSPHGALYPGYFGEREKSRMYLDDAEHFRSSPALIQQLWSECESSDPKQVVAYIDMQGQLPEEFLMMTDRFSMAWSLEARPPFLDRRLVDFVLGLPADIRSPNVGLKSLLIDATRDLLPEDVVGAKKKGFVLPVSLWLRRELRPLVEKYFGRPYVNSQGIFRSDLLDVLARPHLDGKADRSQQIWTVLMFQLWWDRQHGDGV